MVHWSPPCYLASVIELYPDKYKSPDDRLTRVLSLRCEQNCDYPDEEGAFSSLYLKLLEEIFAGFIIFICHCNNGKSSETLILL